jgi:monofunctional glycosyltransferase
MGIEETKNMRGYRMKQRRNARNAVGRVRKWIKRVIVLVCLLAIGYGGFTYYYGHVFPIADVLDTLVHEDVAKHSGVYVPLSDIPVTLQQAIIATEDRRFATDPGIDPIGVARSLLTDVKTQSFAEGGSTITQQLIRNVLLDQSKTFKRKIKEVILSIAAYQHVSKPQILEYYLNDVYFGAGAYGVQKAALTYFGKPLDQLNQGQLTLLAGLPNAPSVINPFVSIDVAKQRQRIVLDRMVNSGYITRAEADSWFAQPLELKPVP